MSESVFSAASRTKSKRKGKRGVPLDLAAVRRDAEAGEKLARPVPTGMRAHQLKDGRVILHISEVDEEGLPIDGYDYGQHLSEVRDEDGGVFISPDGRVGADPLDAAANKRKEINKNVWGSRLSGGAAESDGVEDDGRATALVGSKSLEGAEAARLLSTRDAVDGAGDGRSIAGGAKASSGAGAGSGASASAALASRAELASVTLRPELMDSELQAALRAADEEDEAMFAAEEEDERLKGVDPVLAARARAREEAKERARARGVREGALHGGAGEGGQGQGREESGAGGKGAGNEDEEERELVVGGAVGGFELLDDDFVAQAMGLVAGGEGEGEEDGKQEQGEEAEEDGGVRASGMLVGYASATRALADYLAGEQEDEDEDEEEDEGDKGHGLASQAGKGSGAGGAAVGHGGYGEQDEDEDKYEDGMEGLRGGWAQGDGEEGDEDARRALAMGLGALRGGADRGDHGVTRAPAPLPYNLSQAKPGTYDAAFASVLRGYDDDMLGDPGQEAEEREDRGGGVMSAGDLMGGDGEDEAGLGGMGDIDGGMEGAEGGMGLRQAQPQVPVAGTDKLVEVEGGGPYGGGATGLDGAMDAFLWSRGVDPGAYSSVGEGGGVTSETGMDAQGDNNGEQEDGEVLEIKQGVVDGSGLGGVGEGGEALGIAGILGDGEALAAALAHSSHHHGPSSSSGGRHKGAGRRKKGRPKRAQVSIEEAAGDLAGMMQEARKRGDEKLRKAGVVVKEDVVVKEIEYGRGVQEEEKQSMPADAPQEQDDAAGGGAAPEADDDSRVGLGSDFEDDEEEEEEEEEGDDEYREDEDLMLAHMGVTRGPQRARWDAATIVSTFSVGEHLPTVVGGPEDEEEGEGGCMVGAGIRVQGVGRRGRRNKDSSEAGGSGAGAGGPGGGAGEHGGEGSFAFNVEVGLGHSGVDDGVTSAPASGRAGDASGLTAGMEAVPVIRPEDLGGVTSGGMGAAGRAGDASDAGDVTGDGSIGTGMGTGMGMGGGAGFGVGVPEHLLGAGGVTSARQRGETRAEKLARKRLAKVEKAAARARRRETRGRFAAEQDQARQAAVAARAAGVVGGHVKGQSTVRLA